MEISPAAAPPLGPVADAPDVMRIAQGDTMPYFAFRFFHRFGAFWPKTGVAVKGDGAGIFGDRGVAVELQKTAGMGFHIAWDHPDAMGVMPGQVGGDQVVGDQRRFF